MIIILLGPPGAGKGTQADIIKDQLEIPKLSTGDMLRETVASGSNLGKELQEVMSSGKLVSDDIMIQMIKDRTAKTDCKSGFILDGFPRTLPQAEALDRLFVREDLKLDMVLELAVEESALIERVSGRFACAGCGEGYHDSFKKLPESGKCLKCGSEEFTRRKDDNAETVIERLAGYHKMTEPLLPYYKKQNVLFQIDALQSIDAVTAEIIKTLELAKKAA